MFVLAMEGSQGPLGAFAPGSTTKKSQVSGGHSGGVTPVPIPNTEVKPTSADGTWEETPWESRTPPDFSHEGAPRGALRANYSGDVLLSQGVSPQVPSAQAGLTAVFGMGTGVTPPLWPPETLLNCHIRVAP